MAFSLLNFLEPFWLFNFHLFQPQASPNPYPRVAGSLSSPSHCPRVSSAPSQLLIKFWGRLLRGPGFGLAAAGSWRRGQVEVELRQATGGLGHAGLGRQKKVKKKSKKDQKKQSKKVKCADPSLGRLLEATKSQKSKKKVKSGKMQKKSKKQKNSRKKVNKNIPKKVKCENQARILALADYWRQQKVKNKSKKKSKKSKKSQFCSRLWGRTGLGTCDSGVATRAPGTGLAWG